MTNNDNLNNSLKIIVVNTIAWPPTITLTYYAIFSMSYMNIKLFTHVSANAEASLLAKAYSTTNLLSLRYVVKTYWFSSLSWFIGPTKSRCTVWNTAEAIYSSNILGSLPDCK